MVPTTRKQAYKWENKSKPTSGVDYRNFTKKEFERWFRHTRRMQDIRYPRKDFEMGAHRMEQWVGRLRKRGADCEMKDSKGRNLTVVVYGQKVYGK